MILKFDFSVQRWIVRTIMAARSKFICSLCDKQYDFKSRYDRHLTSAGHQMMVDILELSKNSSQREVDQSVARYSTSPSLASSLIEVEGKFVWYLNEWK